MRSRFLGARREALLAGSALALLAAGPAYGDDFAVGNEAELKAAIANVAFDRIVFTNNITLTADLPAVERNVNFIGNNFTLSGINQFRGLFIGAVSGSTQGA